MGPARAGPEQRAAVAVDARSDQFSFCVALHEAIFGVRPGEIILRGHEDWILKAAFDADERRVVTASADNTARVWQLDEPDQPIVLRGHEDDVRYAGFTPEGRVVTASFDGTVRLWSLDEVAADPPALMEQLRRATTVCLTADQRMRYLEEPAAVAAERFAACERAAGRVP